MTVHKCPTRTGRGHTPTFRRRRRLTSAMVTASVLVMTAACGSHEDPQPESASSASPTAAASQSASPQAFSACMRQNGVAGFPDPDPDGRLILGPDAGIDSSTPEFQKALGACQSLLSGSGAGTGTGQDSGQMVKFSECMRENGVPEFPDPKDGGLTLDPNSDMDPNSPEFQKALQACQSLLPNGAVGGS